MSATFDFHLHSQWSYDAVAPVEDYFKLAREKHLRAFALTDHHTMDGYGDMMECAKKYPDVRFVAGAELTVHCPLGEYDLVCLNLPCEETSELAALFQTYREWQVAYGTAFSRNMLRRGFNVDDAERMRILQWYRPERIIAKQGNTHLRYETIRGYAVGHLFCADSNAYDEMVASFEEMPDYPEYDYVIPIVKRAGGVVMIAHPYGYFEHDNLKRMDELREMFQLDGIECSNWVPKDYCAFYRKYCQSHKLLSTAGSDSHTVDDYGRVAENFSEDRWLDELLERIELH